MFDFRRITLFCLEKRLSKYKMTICSKNLWGMAPLTALATPMQHRSITVVWLTGYEGTNFFPDKLNTKTELTFSLYFGIQYSLGFQWVVVFRVLRKCFGLFSGDFRFQYVEIHIRIGYIFISKLFSECWRGALTVASGPLSATFPTLA